MDPALRLRERCIEMALKTPDIRPNAVHIVAAAYERFIVHGETTPDRADRGDAPAA